MLISGTGWQSDLEHRARLLAHQLGIPSIAVLDHWSNYCERFRREGVEVLPDALWVADEEAAALATAAFPNVPVVQLPNHWLESLSSAVQDFGQVMKAFLNLAVQQVDCFICLNRYELPGASLLKML